ncbi:MAG: helix-turn-helix domain-containing protein [Micromonosporaceae bacterium]
MTDTVGSALIRRYVGRRFVALRNRAGLTQEQAAIALQRARATLGRIEDGDERVRFRDIDVRGMLELYQASPQEGEVLLALTAETRKGRKKSWWRDFTETAIPAFFTLYVVFEDSAETIRQYESELIPGLLQTRAYAEQINRMPPGHIDEEETQRRVRVRLERQSLLTRPRAPHLFFVLNEAVLHRPVGGGSVMAEQLGHVLEATQRVGVSVRVLPWSAGAHGAMGASNTFALLEFPRGTFTGEPLEPPLAYVDSLTGAMYLQKPEEVNAYHLVWDDLEKRALDEAESRTRITAALKGFTSA